MSRLGNILQFKEQSNTAIPIENNKNIFTYASQVIVTANKFIILHFKELLGKTILQLQSH